MTIDLHPGDLIKSPQDGIPKFIRGSLVVLDEIRLVTKVEPKEPFKDSLTITWIVSPLGTITSGTYGKTMTWEIID